MSKPILYKNHSIVAVGSRHSWRAVIDDSFLVPLRTSKPQVIELAKRVIRFSLDFHKHTYEND